MNSLNNIVLNSVERLDRWIKKNGWAGYDPFDIKQRVIAAHIKSHFINKLIQHSFSEIESFAPIKFRKLFNIKKEINAKAMGLFAKSYLNLFQTGKNEEDLNKAQDALNWLEDNCCSGYSGKCWGYPFNWQSKILIPRGTPSSVVTSVVGNAYWAFYKFTQDHKYLNTCASICNFFMKDLNNDSVGEDKICFSYTPLDYFHINNANLFVAEFLIRIGKETNNEQYYQQGLKAVNYTLSEQNNDGSICYAGKDQVKRCHIDHYHSGFEIRSLYSVWKLTNDKNIGESLKRYYKFYLGNLFTSDNIPKMTPDNLYPINIHSCAEAILCTSTLFNDFPEGKEHLIKSLKWTIDNMQTEEGWFIYMIKDIKLIKRKVAIPYIRWGQAWMLRALAEAIPIIESGYLNEDSPGRPCTS